MRFQRYCDLTWDWRNYKKKWLWGATVHRHQVGYCLGCSLWWIDKNISSSNWCDVALCLWVGLSFWDLQFHAHYWRVRIPCAHDLIAAKPVVKNTQQAIMFTYFYTHFKSFCRLSISKLSYLQPKQSRRYVSRWSHRRTSHSPNVKHYSSSRTRMVWRSSIGVFIHSYSLHLLNVVCAKQSQVLA